MPKTVANEIAEVEEKDNLPATAINFEDDAGAGIEQADSDSYAIPMLKVLQSLSPQCDPDDGVDGAKPGALFNTVTNEVYMGDEGVTLIPCHFTHTFIEWVPRDQGGGFVAEHQPGAAILEQKQRTERGSDRLPNGNEVEDTRNHYCLMVHKDGSYDPVLVTMSVTQIPTSKKWMTRIGNIRKRGKNGMFNPPSFSHQYQLTTVKKKNDKGSWYVPEVNMIGEVTDMDLYLAAKDFYEKVKSGAVKERVEDRRQETAPTSTGEEPPVNDADIPF